MTDSFFFWVFNRSSNEHYLSCFGWFQDIVEHLVENSTTYNERTQFSKAKYKNKKMKKYDLAS